MSLLMVISGILAGAAAIIFFMRPKPLHIQVPSIEKKVLGINMFPLMMWMAGLMTDGMRKNTATKQNAPKPDTVVRDLYDVTGETPYKIQEIKPGKIWQITYTSENLSLTNKSAQGKAAALMDPRSETFRRKGLEGAASFGEKAVEVVKRDLDTSLKWFNKETVTDIELIEAMNKKLNSFIVKLDNGSLLWYCPVRIREEVGFGSWLDSLGKLEWIVVASSYHTLSIKFATDRYPNAKIVGAPAAQDKLNCINALPRKKFDYDCTDSEDLKAANDILEREGVTLCYIDGDVATNAIVAVAHKVALEVDLVYTHSDGQGFSYISRDRFLEFRPEDWGMRLFKFSMMSKPHAPHGFLPTYRYSMMDPTSIGAMSYDKPASDGSTCGVMAESLRRMLKMDFEAALGVHGNSQRREEFRNNIEVNWNWLDGQSLL